MFTGGDFYFTYLDGIARQARHLEIQKRMCSTN